MTEMEEREPEVPEIENIETEPAEGMHPADSVEQVVEYVSAQDDEAEPEKTEDRPALTIVVQSWATPVVGVLMLVVGLLGGYFGRPLVASQTPEPTAQVAVVPPTTASSSQSPDSGELMRVISEQTRHFIGSEDAPVTIIEFSDFQWAYCGSFAAGAGRQIFEQYVQTGKVRFGYIHFAFLGQGSVLAAEASECAAEQDAFWPYHDLVFENQTGIDADALKGFAADLGLDEDAFATCLDEGKYADVVNSQSGFSRSIGVQSTPSFVVNGQPVVGAQGFDVFQQMIEAELQAGQ